SIVLPYLPAQQRPAKQLDQECAERAETADHQHADDDLRVLDQGVSGPGEVTDTVLAADDFAGQKGEPGDTHANGETGDNARQCTGQYHMPKDGGVAGAETARRPYQ